jgi:hypothetical protein
MPQRLKGDHPPTGKDRSDPSESGLSVLCRPLSIVPMTEVALGPWPYHLYGRAGWGLDGPTTTGVVADRRERRPNGQRCPSVVELGAWRLGRWDSNPVPCRFAVRGRGGGCRVICNSDLPNVTARARREPAVTDAVRAQRGPGSRAWKARPVVSSWPDAAPMPQVRRLRDRPLLTVRDRQMPMLRARRGHGRRGSTALQHGSDGYKLNRRVRPVHGDHLPRWQASGGRAAVGSRNPCSPLPVRQPAGLASDAIRRCTLALPLRPLSRRPSRCASWCRRR